MWLSEKEEEEVGFDWGERNSNMAAKKESYSVRPPSGIFQDCPAPVGSPGAGWWGDAYGRLVDPGEGPTPFLSPVPPCQALMRELELREKKIKEIQSTGDRLLREGHPARPTVEVGWARAPRGHGGGWAGRGGRPRGPWWPWGTSPRTLAATGGVRAGRGVSHGRRGA